MPENQEAFSLYCDIVFWGGGGYTKDGLLVFGEGGGIASGLLVVQAFSSHRKTPVQTDRLYRQLKIIHGAINRGNAKVLERLEKENAQRR